jgi:hypothetical protein
MKKQKVRFLPYPSFFIMSSLSLSLFLQVALRVLGSVFIILFSSITHHPNISSYLFIYLFIYLCLLQLIAPTKPCLGNLPLLVWYMLGPQYDVV